MAESIGFFIKLPVGELTVDSDKRHPGGIPVCRILKQSVRRAFFHFMICVIKLNYRFFIRFCYQAYILKLLLPCHFTCDMVNELYKSADGILTEYGRIIFTLKKHPVAVKRNINAQCSPGA